MKCNKGDKHINEVSKQIFGKNHFKIPCKNMQGKPFNWNVSFNVFAKRNFNEVFRISCKINVTVQKMTNTNYPIQCKQTTKTT